KVFSEHAYCICFVACQINVFGCGESLDLDLNTFASLGCDPEIVAIVALFHRENSQMLFLHPFRGKIHGKFLHTSIRSWLHATFKEEPSPCAERFVIRIGVDVIRAKEEKPRYITAVRLPIFHWIVLS